MPDLHQALADISAIRGQMARGTLFRGYGPAALATTGLLAVLAALAQAAWLPDAVSEIGSYLALWIATALLSVAIVAIEAVRRSRQAHGGLADDMIQAAAEQFLPSAIAGVLLTWVICRYAPHSIWMLPGLWQIVYSLGIFASCRLLPRATFWVAVFYLGTGLAVLTAGDGQSALSPWAMGVPFGVGQLLAAAVLYRTLERDHGAQ